MAAMLICGMSTLVRAADEQKTESYTDQGYAADRDEMMQDGQDMMNSMMDDDMMGNEETNSMMEEMNEVNEDMGEMKDTMTK